MKQDLTGTLSLTDLRGRILFTFYASGTSLVALLNLRELVVPALGLGALVLLWVALAILGRPGEEVLDTRTCVGLLGLLAAISLMSAWNLRAASSPGYANWYLGASTFVMLVLAVRGRLGVAWLGFGIMAAVVLASIPTTSESPTMVMIDLARQAGTLGIGTLFALMFRRATRIIRSIQDRQADRIASEAAIEAAAHERAAESERLERYARPALERIAEGRPLSESERRAMALLEAQLRDGIRAAGFTTPAIVQAVRDAREREVHIALVDDRGGALPPADVERVEDALLTELRRAADGGRITARLSPADSDEIATIVAAEGDAYRSVIVRRTGVEVTRLSGD
ncbi:MAG: hypothetical protein QM635_00015 [Microbacteriaceae bacterium]